MSPTSSWEDRALEAFWSDEFKEHTLSSPDRMRASLAAIAPWMVAAADHLWSTPTQDNDCKD